MIEIILLISLVLNIFLFMFTRNLYKQTGMLEEAVYELADRLDDVRDNVQVTLEHLREVDSRGAFESDDEVGVTFKILVDTIEELNKEI